MRLALSLQQAESATKTDVVAVRELPLKLRIVGTSPTQTYFKVCTADEKRYILRYAEADDEWTLQSGFDGDESLSQPGITLITVDADVIRQAEARSTPCTAIPPQRFH